MSTNRRKLRLNTVTVDLGCSSCRKPKLSHIFHPKPKPKHTLFHSPTASCQKFDTHYAAPEYSNDSPARSDSDIRSMTAVQGFGRVGGESVAVEKDSNNPYLDFRRSMLQMILEKEIYSKEDLKELLNCFLQLNSPYYHRIIVRAFTEIWHGVFSANYYSKSPHF